MVSAEMLNCRAILSTQAADKMAFLLSMMRWKPSLARHGRTLTRTLYSGKKPNDIARKLNLFYISMIKSKLKASNTSLNSDEYDITRN
jgi:hypothetical protein